MKQTRRQQAKAARWTEWRGILAEAEESRLSVRQFCQQRHVGEAMFYRWRRRLRDEPPAGSSSSEARFVLVRPAAKEEVESKTAPIELVLDRGWRLRIARGADEATLRVVLAALAPRP
ncbi:MAG: IS66 family insertion sequence element accessory protein TnpA [Thermoguttaceae bacterium]